MVQGAIGEKFEEKLIRANMNIPSRSKYWLVPLLVSLKYKLPAANVDDLIWNHINRWMQFFNCNNVMLWLFFWGFDDFDSIPGQQYWQQATTHLASEQNGCYL